MDAKQVFFCSELKLRTLR